MRDIHDRSDFLFVLHVVTVDFYSPVEIIIRFDLNLYFYLFYFFNVTIEVSFRFETVVVFRNSKSLNKRRRNFTKNFLN